jgi:hypothetical protein
MAVNSNFLKTLQRFTPVLAVTVLLTAVTGADSDNKVHWARSTDGVRIAYEVRGGGSLALVFVHAFNAPRGKRTSGVVEMDSACCWRRQYHALNVFCFATNRRTTVGAKH